MIPIQIGIPADALPTDETSLQSQTIWRLNVDAEVPGVDFSAKFEVPVFRSALPETQPQTIAPRPVVSAPAERTIGERETAEGLDLDFPPFRARSVAVSTFVFTAFWIAAIVFVIHIRAPLLVPIVLSLFGLILVYLTLDLLFGSSLVRIGADGVTIQQRLLLFRSEQRLPGADISDVRLKIGMQSGSGAGQPYYNLEIVTRDGKSITAGKYLRSKREAEWLVSRIRERVAPATSS
jgi:hypothetical protein